MVILGEEGLIGEGLITVRFPENGSRYTMLELTRSLNSLNISLMTGFFHNREAINLADFGEYPEYLAAAAPVQGGSISPKQNLSHRRW